MAQRNSHPKYSQFRFDTGSLSLNFVATVRHRGSPPRELLTSPDSLREWLQIVGLITSSAVISSGDFGEAIVLREAIHDTVRSLIMNRKPNSGDVDLINRTARFSIAVPQLHTGAARIKWETTHPVKAALAVIARDAITLIADTERVRLKKCDGSTCQMLFVDSSPGNRRRWCAMSICGNRQKVTMHRRKKVYAHGSAAH